MPKSPASSTGPLFAQSTQEGTDERKKRAATGPVAIQDLFSKFALEDKGGYITQEFQDYGYRLAVALNDMAHKSLYIRMAKNYSRGLLENALSFVADSNAKSKARLFMWKVKQLKKELKPATKAKSELSK